MQIIDTHQHFWHYDPERHGWINEDMQVLKHDFLPEHLLPILKQSGVSACIAVQAEQTEDETNWLLSLAQANPFIKAVVGWVDLLSDTLEERLAYYQSFPLLKGFRHILQAEEPAFMLQEKFVKGIQQLGRFGFTYDILIYPQHFNAAIALVKQCPDQRFVLDHLGKPDIRNGKVDDWRNDISTLASFENVYCKVSGMVTEADWQHWQPAHLQIYLDVAVEAFGCDRLMWGSDWPVCTLAADYHRWLQVALDYFSTFSGQEQQAIFAGNAMKFYGC